jgi:hypothetical protein
MRHAPARQGIILLAHEALEIGAPSVEPLRHLPNPASVTPRRKIDLLE